MAALEPQVVHVAPPRGRHDDDKMTQARTFCSDHSGDAECPSSPPSYESGKAAYRSGALPHEQPYLSADGASTGWSKAVPRSEPVATSPAASFRGGAFASPMLSSPAKMNNVRSFVTQHGPEGAQMVQCMLQRRKNHTYELFLRDESRHLEHGQFLLATRKTDKKSGTYRVSTSRNDFEKKSGNYLGKIKASELTGVFTLVDSGTNPRKLDAWDKDEGGGASVGARQTLAEVSFAKPTDKRLPDLRHVKLPPTEQRLHTMPPQVDRDGKLTQVAGN